jgi:hypothetical protein
MQLRQTTRDVRRECATLRCAAQHAAGGRSQLEQSRGSITGRKGRRRSHERAHRRTHRRAAAHARTHARTHAGSASAHARARTRRYSRGYSLGVVAVYGGKSKFEQFKELRAGWCLRSFVCVSFVCSLVCVFVCVSFVCSFVCLLLVRSFGRAVAQLVYARGSLARAHQPCAACSAADLQVRRS